MKPADSRILTGNGGSPSIKLALFEAGDSPRRIVEELKGLDSRRPPFE